MLPIRLDEAAVDDLFAARGRASGLPADGRSGEAARSRDEYGLSLAVRGRRLPPPLPAERPGRHRPDARARGQDHGLRAGARDCLTDSRDTVADGRSLVYALCVRKSIPPPGELPCHKRRNTPSGPRRCRGGHSSGAPRPGLPRRSFPSRSRRHLRLLRPPVRSTSASAPAPWGWRTRLKAGLDGVEVGVGGPADKLADRRPGGPAAVQGPDEGDRAGRSRRS